MLEIKLSIPNMTPKYSSSSQYRDRFASSSLIIPKEETFTSTYFKSDKEGVAQLTAHSERLQPSVKTLS